MEKVAMKVTSTVAVLLVSLFPLCLAAQESKGVSLYKKGQFAEAASELKVEVDKAPGNEQALTYLGLARVRAGNADGAREPLMKALSMNADNAEAHFGMGLVHLKQGKRDEGVAELEKAVKLSPNHAYAHYYLGMTYNQSGKKDVAVPHLRRFVELAPDAPEAPAIRSFLERM